MNKPELTDEKIKRRINAIEDRRSASRDFWDGDYEYPEDIELLALRELQERRKADSAAPVAWTDEEELRDANVAGIGYLFGIDQEANKFADPRRQVMLYRHARPAPDSAAQAELKRLAVILHGSETDLNLLTVTAQSLIDRCKATARERDDLHVLQLTPEREQVRREHAEWSDVTFGDVGPVGPLKHLSKEALEAAAEPGDLSEWADMQFLLWDAQRRAGISDEQITLAMVEKLTVNKQREWPEPKDGEPRLHIKELSELEKK
jgi:hypothetical protein